MRNKYVNNVFEKKKAEAVREKIVWMFVNPASELIYKRSAAF